MLIVGALGADDREGATMTADLRAYKLKLSKAQSRFADTIISFLKLDYKTGRYSGATAPQCLCSRGIVVRENVLYLQVYAVSQTIKQITRENVFHLNDLGILFDYCDDNSIEYVILPSFYREIVKDYMTDILFRFPDNMQPHL